MVGNELLLEEYRSGVRNLLERSDTNPIRPVSIDCLRIVVEEMVRFAKERIDIVVNKGTMDFFLQIVQPSFSCFSSLTSVKVSIIVASNVQYLPPSMPLITYAHAPSSIPELDVLDVSYLVVDKSSLLILDKDLSKSIMFPAPVSVTQSALSLFSNLWGMIDPNKLEESCYGGRT